MFECLEMFNWFEFQTFSAQIYKIGTLESSVLNCPATLDGVQSFAFAQWQNILEHFLEVNASDGLLKYGHGRSNPLEVRWPQPICIFGASCSGSSGFGSETRKRTSFTSSFQNYYPVTNSKSKKLSFYPYFDQLHKVPEFCLLIWELFYSLFVVLVDKDIFVKNFVKVQICSLGIGCGMWWGRYMIQNY